MLQQRQRNFDSVWVGANGDWIARVGFKWELVNVYTRREIPLPVVPLQATKYPNIFLLDNGFSAVLQKIVICQVPTAAWGYKDFSLVTVFDLRIAVLRGDDDGWKVLMLPDRKSTRLNSSHSGESRMPSSA